MIKSKYKLFKLGRILIILFVVSILSLPFLIKNTDNDFCYKSEASFWGRQDMKIDCSSNNVDLVKKEEYINFGFTQLKNILIWTFIINIFFWVSTLENKNKEDVKGRKHDE